MTTCFIRTKAIRFRLKIEFYNFWNFPCVTWTKGDVLKNALIFFYGVCYWRSDHHRLALTLRQKKIWEFDDDFEHYEKFKRKFELRVSSRLHKKIPFYGWEIDQKWSSKIIKKKSHVNETRVSPSQIAFYFFSKAHFSPLTFSDFLLTQSFIVRSL